MNKNSRIPGAPAPAGAFECGRRAVAGAEGRMGVKKGAGAPEERRHRKGWPRQVEEKEPENAAKKRAGSAAATGR